MALEDIVVIYNFITEEERSMLLNYEKNLTEKDLWEKRNYADPQSQWTNRHLSIIHLLTPELGFGTEHDIQVAKKLWEIEGRIRAQIKKSWNLEKDIWPDCFNLIRWPHGQAQPPHSDYENFSREPHVWNWRDIGCVLYLNDEFEEGEIRFPQFNREIKIEAGMLAFFPGDIHHAHGVKEVKNGTRYTLNTFYTFSEDHRFEVDFNRKYGSW